MRPLGKRLPALGLLLLGALAVVEMLCLPCSAQEEEAPTAPLAPRGVLYRLEGQLSQTMVTSLRRCRRIASSIGASCLIIEIDTPGGESTLMEQLRDLVFDAHNDDNLETVAFINPNADSAGALIAIACKRIYMSPLGHMGSATPIAINPLPFGAAPIPINEDLERKIKARAQAIFRATANENGRNIYIAEAMVDPDIELVLARIDGQESVLTRDKYIDERTRVGPGRALEIDVICEKGDLLNITAQEAFDVGFIDGIPESRADLIENFLDLEVENVTIVSRTWSEGLVDFIQSFSWLLLVAGLVLLYIEFKIPGFGVFGIIGLSCLALLFFNQWLAGLAEIPEIFLIVIGVGLVAVEIFVLPGTFIPAAIGFLLIVVGTLLSFQPFIIPESPWDVEILESNIISLGLSMLAFVAVAMMITRFLPKAPLFRRLILDSGPAPGALYGTAGALDDVRQDIPASVGETGVVLKELRPVGRISVNDLPLDAQSEGGYISKGDKVRIVRIVGNLIFVRKVEDKTP